MHASLVVSNKNEALKLTSRYGYGFWSSDDGDMGIYNTVHTHPSSFWEYYTETEKAFRLKIFLKNVEFIDTNGTYKLSLNEFADLSPEEFRAAYTAYKMPTNKKNTTELFWQQQNLTHNTHHVVVPSALDWRAKGAVTPVKSQGSKCAVSAVEGISKIRTGKLVSLSEQQILDCSKPDGCKGSSMEDVSKYIIKNHGLTTEQIYPYQQKKRGCNGQKEAKIAAKIKNYKRVVASEGALLEAVAMQPVSWN
ncbi:Senescence-specific cysteine protease [Melia azedarach]|uniref:Senescence-specific cysteine protease n=1 Tax=Melia azedarach TaxID=155640 RepID=A0ACC1XCS8_MELAZ|nr:Senescence-specific cysteine protease [Melia azedarach]